MEPSARPIHIMDLNFFLVLVTLAIEVNLPLAGADLAISLLVAAAIGGLVGRIARLHPDPMILLLTWCPAVLMVPLHLHTLAHVLAFLAHILVGCLAHEVQQMLEAT